MTQRMIPEPDPVPGTETEKTGPDHPDMPVLISVDDFFDLLMEQQEQM